MVDWLMSGVAVYKEFSKIMMTEIQTKLARYRLVAAESKFIVRAFAEGLFSAFGHDPVISIKDFAGSVEFVPGSFEAASLRVEIKPIALAVINDVKEKDRHEIEHTMREQVLESDKYPEIVFVSTSISATSLRAARYRARIIGDLTLHGVTQKNLWISTEISLSDDRSLRAQGEFSIRQTDFGIKLVSVAGGMLKVKNELKFSFDIVARPDE